VNYVPERAPAFVPEREASAGTGVAMVFSFKLRFPAFKPKSADSRLVPAEHVVSTMHGTRTVLLDAYSGHYWGLDDVGTRIWSLMQDGLTDANDIAEKLGEEYDVPLERLRSDVTAFFESMRRLKVLREVA